MLTFHALIKDNRLYAISQYSLFVFDNKRRVTVVPLSIKNDIHMRDVKDWEILNVSDGGDSFNVTSNSIEHIKGDQYIEIMKQNKRPDIVYWDVVKKEWYYNLCKLFHIND